MRMFTLVITWIDEYACDDEIQLEAFISKEAMLEAKKYFEQKYEKEIEAGLVLLSPAIEYSWADFERIS